MDGLNSEDKLKKYAEFLSKLPPPPRLETLDSPDPNKMLCACGREVNMTDMDIIDTGVIKAIDNVCKGCNFDHDKKAVIVCCGCRTPFATVVPEKDKDGFEFIAGKFYHTEFCPVCKPGSTSAPILEKIVFYRKNNIPYKEE